MKAFILSSWFAVLGVTLLGAAQAASPTNDAALSQLPNVQYPQPNRIVSGAIDAEAVQSLRKAGIKHVINLRTSEEMAKFDEERAVTEQGLAYHHLPIKGAESLTEENARKLDSLLAQIGAEPALIHCSSGNRVGALIAVREARIKGQSTDAAVAQGKRWGLTKLEEPVRELLSK